MTTKFTPGPWTVRYDYVVQAPSFDGGRLVPVAQPYGVNSDGTDLFANARLIAAAPELLEAARDLIEAWGQLSGTSKAHCGQVLPAVHAARRAVLAATGEKP